ncbi:hypothetical protein QBC38DRAFT_462461 [Podospora fimiseda]|uniref:Uncharacterized protein n=1 Tax=Podospora fimiseda TaxID=252190 RepID=A0AAN6YKV4_9PEZI|nr:hypothetical protein QBC38DRAFT_462461 [Podospora fimiseda]
MASQLKRLRTALDTIAAGEVDLTNKTQLKDFVSNEIPNLAKPTKDKKQPTVLHLLAVDQKAQHPNLPKINDFQMKLLVGALIRHNSALVGIRDDQKRTALYHTIDVRNEKMVEWMCDAHPDINSILSESKNNQHYLHLAIKKKLKYFPTLAKKANGQTLALRDSKENTVLHLLVEHRRCREGQLAVIEDNQDWTLSQIFGKYIKGTCPLTDPTVPPVCLQVPNSRSVYVSDGVLENKNLDRVSRCFEISPIPTSRWFFRRPAMTIRW